MTRPLLTIASTPPAPRFDAALIDRYAFCYTATATGKQSGVRLLFTIEDAMRWCSSPVSRGALHGSEWMYCWTACTTFFDVLGPELDLDRIDDNGSWDDRIAATGAVKIPLEQWAGIFHPAGIEVTGAGVKEPVKTTGPVLAPVDQLDLLGAAA